MNKLSSGVRVMLGIAAIPGVFLITVMAIDAFYYGIVDLDAFSLVYGTAALYLVYLAVSGKPASARGTGGRSESAEPD